MEHEPCLVCGEPKPDDKPCLNADCAQFGGAKRVINITFEVVAFNAEALPTDDQMRGMLEDGLEHMGWYESEVSTDGVPIQPWLNGLWVANA